MPNKTTFIERLRTVTASDPLPEEGINMFNRGCILELADRLDEIDKRLASYVEGWPMPSDRDA